MPTQHMDSPEARAEELQAQLTQLDTLRLETEAGLRAEIDQLKALLAAEKADHADTQKKWDEALNLGLKCIKQRDAARAALEYWRSECTFREPSLSLAQRKTEEALAL